MEAATLIDDIIGDPIALDRSKGRSETTREIPYAVPSQALDWD